MSEDNSIASVNERLARQINQQARQDPKSPYAPGFLGQRATQASQGMSQEVSTHVDSRL